MIKMNRINLILLKKGKIALKKKILEQNNYKKIKVKQIQRKKALIL